METYTNEKGEERVIADLANPQLIHSIAKYSATEGKDSEVVKALKAEAIKRLSETNTADHE